MEDDTVSDELTKALAAVFFELETLEDDGDGNAPGHGHRTPGIWGSDNGKLAGKPCGWCAVWNHAKGLLKAQGIKAPATTTLDAEP